MSDEITLRPLNPGDLNAMIEIDARQGGVRRSGFYEKRLAAMARAPARFAGTAAIRNGKLAGFAIARVVQGEFGKTGARARLDAIGVERDARRAGIGQAVLAGLEKALRDAGVAEIQTEVDWSNQTLLRFLNRSGFTPAHRLVLERPVARGAEF